MRASLTFALLACTAPFVAHAASVETGGPLTDAQAIASAESAAPAAVAKDAEIVTFDAQGNMRTIRKGTNGYICMPDTPESPGPDPECVDKGGMAWTMAWVNHKDPPKGVIGFGYMLAGGSDPDNMDPFATKPPPGQAMGDDRTTCDAVQRWGLGERLSDRQTTGYVKAVCDVPQYSIRAHHGSSETIRLLGWPAVSLRGRRFEAAKRTATFASSLRVATLLSSAQYSLCNSSRLRRASEWGHEDVKSRMLPRAPTATALAKNACERSCGSPLDLGALSSARP